MVIVVVVVLVVVVVETGILQRRENMERERGDRWQVQGWELRLVAAVGGIGRGMVVVVIKVSMVVVMELR